MNKIKYTIPLLAIVLLIPAGMSNVTAQEVPGGEELEANGVGPVGDVGVYVDLLKLDEDYQNMTEEQQETYIQSANEFITAQSAYELARNELLVEASRISLQIHATNDEQRIEELKIQHDEIFSQLEEFGVGPEDKVHDNPSYYFDKYDQALAEFETQGYAATVTDIHTNDVSLSNQAGILFPCYPSGWGFSGTCPIRTLTYGPGTSHVEVWFVAPSGTITFESKICLDRSVQHNQVYFKMTSVERINTNIFGTQIHYDSNTENTSVDGMRNSCQVIQNSESIDASNRASLDSTLGSRIIVGGSHT